MPDMSTAGISGIAKVFSGSLKEYCRVPEFRAGVIRSKQFSVESPGLAISGLCSRARAFASQQPHIRLKLSIERPPLSLKMHHPAPTPA